jgi:hypothetical protein
VGQGQECVELTVQDLDRRDGVRIEGPRSAVDKNVPGLTIVVLDDADTHMRLLAPKTL